MAKDPAILAHQEWLGYVQPVGLVVSIPALLDANARINRNFGPDHQKFLSALPTDRDGDPVPEISSFPEFAQTVFGWSLQDLCGAPGAPPVPNSLEAPLPEYNETLRPTCALREFEPKDPNQEWILLIQEIPKGTEFDTVAVSDERRWQASPQARFERLLRETRSPTGLLVDGRQIRLVYAPRGEASGYITFNLADMVQVAGRPIVAALLMLLSYERLYSMAEDERLPAILENSRKFQNVVSIKLAGQVLEALYELLRGFQAADDQTHGELLRDMMARDPNHVYSGLVTTLLRMVFILFAEDRDLLPADPIYTNYYSVTGLYERLRADDGRYHDTMDQRYGAWAQLLALFRLIYHGGSHGGMRIPAREGYLFDPDRYLFLEGRRERTDPPSIPRVSDGVVFRILSKLLLLDGERLSYRTLAVEQIGSVYEAIMGFELHVASGLSIGIKPAKRNGAPATINLEELLAQPGAKRLKWLADNTDQKLAGQAANALTAASTMEDLLAALDRKIAKEVTPNVVTKGAMIFQPSNERRRSGSHYTPSSLTGPIVEAALRPVLKQLGEKATPEQILELNVCDPAMGSGAFLVEACRQLGDALVRAWHVHNCAPAIPRDEDEVLHARRRIAQRCLYGVDKNPLAADLAKLSLWLATLAKDHSFTFLNHSLRAGDSLVGLTRKQIAAFHWLPSEQKSFLEDELRKRIDRVSEVRQRILAAADDTSYSVLQARLDEADAALTWIRMAGDAAIAAFFKADKPKEREKARASLQAELELALKDQLKIDLVKPIEAEIDKLRKGPKGVMPFHWEIEFPEVFTVDPKGSVIGGFDVIVGNPPFAYKNTIIASHAEEYPEWLQTIHEGSHGNSDLVAHFFRQAFTLLRPGGSFGLIATNTIGQGDTRSTGLRWICTHGGTIYQALKRLKWPGEAAVTVSIVHIFKGTIAGPYLLDGQEVPIITAYLFHGGSHEEPAVLTANSEKSFVGSYVMGLGFTFDATDTTGVANSLAEMQSLIERNPRNGERIFPYIGGEDVNESPSLSYHRYVIDFFDRSLEEAAKWPDLIEVLRIKVKPERDKQKRDANRERWWQFAEKRPGLYRTITRMTRVLVVSIVTKHLGFVFLPTGLVYSHRLQIFATESWRFFAVLQSSVHEFWARFFSSTLEDRINYSGSDCFDTFPFPSDFETLPTLEQAGREYYEFRAALMVKNNEGLTATYNRFHDPEEENPDILRLRELHAAMDRAVLDAYGWTDLQPECEFLLDYEEEEDEEETGPRRRKKPWRYRWPDEMRDEVLARLLELNRQRALEEGQVEAASVATEETGIANNSNKRRKMKSTNDGVHVPAQGLFAKSKGES
jgi:hypothetical protein